jgi:hypothetical protein
VRNAYAAAGGQAQEEMTVRIFEEILSGDCREVTAKAGV